jgi:hypothetical protein
VAVKGILFHLDTNLVDELKHIFDDLWEVWPRVDEIHKYNSDWKQTDFSSQHLYEARYCFNHMPAGDTLSDRFLVIQVDKDHNVHLIVIATG